MCFKNECGSCIIQFWNAYVLVGIRVAVLCVSSTEWLRVFGESLPSHKYAVPVAAIVGKYVVLYQPYARAFRILFQL